MTNTSSALASDDFLGLLAHAEGMPSAVALAAPGRKATTYGELADRLREIRRELTDAGFGSGEVAALALPSGPELITAFLAISGIGAAAPLNPAFTESEFRFFLKRLGASTLLAADGVALPAVAAAQALGIRVLRIRSSEHAAAGCFSLASEANAAAALSARRTDAALLLCTSATSGSPKLVPLTRENLRAMTDYDTSVLRLTAADRFLSMLPLFHMYGLSAVLAQLSCGGAVWSTPGFDPRMFLAWLEQFRPTWFASVSPINRALLTLARDNREAFQCSSLRMIRTLEATPGVLTELENAAGVPVLTGYGLTEMGGVTRSTPAAHKPGSVGRSSGLEVAIQDSSGNLLAAGLEGEVVIRGASVTSGYLDEADANQAAFRGGWFHTGDLGRLDSEGFLFLTGRMKEMINRAGEKIAPAEVEDVLMAHPAVADAVVFAVSHPTLGEDIAAAVVLRDGAAASVLDLRQFAALRLAAFKVPRRFVFLDIIPRSVNGKAQRTLLAEQFQNRAKRPPEELP